MVEIKTCLKCNVELQDVIEVQNGIKLNAKKCPECGEVYIPLEELDKL